MRKLAAVQQRCLASRSLLRLRTLHILSRQSKLRNSQSKQKRGLRAYAYRSQLDRSAAQKCGLTGGSPPLSLALR